MDLPAENIDPAHGIFAQRPNRPFTEQVARGASNDANIIHSWVRRGPAMQLCDTLVFPAGSMIAPTLSRQYELPLAPSMSPTQPVCSGIEMIKVQPRAQ